MAADGASQEQPGRHRPDASGDQAEQTHPAERFGVVDVARYVKDDGRALLIYRRVEDGET
ncbi:MAG TPA: hypothetical protein VNZ01_13885 [Solirubrobacteraceae bacterium]|jgi:hypothetical protein|nr:hypothetical protein [Solirubrobacteraceae bacterium]